jgi:threonine/homoserine/homoserine lactone efflux protein
LAFLLLGATFLITGTVWCLILALAAGSLRSLLSPGSRGARLLRRITGGVFVLLGLRVAASKT